MLNLTSALRRRIATPMLAAALLTGCSAATPFDGLDDAGPDAFEHDGSSLDPDARDCLDTEVCGDGVDDDCDGSIDEGCDDAGCDHCGDECEPGAWVECTRDGELGVARCDERGLPGSCHLCPPGVEVPTEERCGDSVDDDCDGAVDEDCPEPADCLCVPGEWRTCDPPIYDGWGVQFCRADGLDWGRCTETAIPSGCEESSWYSPEGELCCITAGLCCQDMWDLDFDGDSWESVGACEGIVCEGRGGELCGDGLDNDDDGRVDETCEGCECDAGATRVCAEPAYGSDWGVQTCTERGEWGPCGLSDLPEACAFAASYSVEVEACCISLDLCCQDLWDLDFDGDDWDSLGSCSVPGCRS